MWSSLIRSACLATIVAGCTDDPTILVTASRPPGTMIDVGIEVCASSAHDGCTGMHAVFAGTTGSSRTVGVYVNDDSPGVTLFFTMTSGGTACARADVELAGGARTGTLTLDTGAIRFVCDHDTCISSPCE